jgi:hypothetical protein
VYCADNPVKYIDPDGREIKISSTVDDKGNKTVNIYFTAYLKNESTEKISEKNMQVYADRMSNAIQNYFGGMKQDADGNQFNVNVTADIQVKKQGEIVQDILSRHSISIVDKVNSDNPGAVGYSEVGGNYMQIATTVLRYKPEMVGKYKDTGLTVYGTSTLERTAAHEFGHLGGLLDISSPDSNLMIQGIIQNAGSQIIGSQIKEMQKNYLDTYPIIKPRNYEQKINKGIFR